jgi:hypothetical protein
MTLSMENSVFGRFLMPIWRNGTIGNFELLSVQIENFYERLEQFNFPEDKDVRRIEIYDWTGMFNGIRFYDEQNNLLGQLGSFSMEGWYDCNYFAMPDMLRKR